MYNPTPSTSHNYYDPVASTSSQQWGGLMAVSTSTQSNSFGSYQQVQAVTGTASTVTVGGSYYSSSSSTTSQASFSLGSAASATNLVYSSTAPYRVDGGGLALSLSTGGVAVLQFNASSGQLQVQTTTGTLTGLVTYFAVALYNPSLGGSACSNLGLTPTSAVSVAQTTCPTGQVSIPMGDVSTNDTNTYKPASSNALYANVLYTRPLFVPITGVQVTQLSTFVGRNPASIIHMRLGLYSASNIQLYPGYPFEVTGGALILLTQTGIITLNNTDAGLVTANLLTPITLNQSVTSSVAQTSYFVGVMVDVPLLAPVTYYFYFPSTGVLWSPVSLPTSFTANTYAYGVPLIGATGCVGSSGTTTFAFAVSLVYTTCSTCSPSELQFQGYLLGVSVGNGAYYAIAGGGTGALVTAYSTTAQTWGLGGFSFAADQVFYPSSSQPVSTLGLSLAYWTSTQTPSQAVFQWLPSAGTVGIELGSDAFIYTAVPYITVAYSLQFSSTQTTLTAPALSVIAPLNYIGPSGVAGLVRASCLIPATLGVVDSSKYTTSTSLSGNVAYSTSVSATAGVNVSQLAMSVLSNSTAAVALHLAVYDATGALVASTVEVTLRQVVYQTIYIALTAPFTTSAQQYRIVLLANTSLSIAGGASTISALPLTYSSTVPLPSSFTPTASGPALPVALVGCGTPTHTFCAQFQYLSSATPPVGTVVVYSGLLQAGALTTTPSGVQGYPAVLGTGHLMSLSNGFAGNYGNTPKYQSLTLAKAGYIYTSPTATLDASGLAFTAAATTSAVGQSPFLYSLGSKVMENSTFSQGSTIVSNFSLSPYSAAAGIPACSGFNPFFAPIVQTPANPAAVSCPSGSTAVTYGSTLPSYDYYYYSLEGDEEIYPYYIFAQPFTTGAASVSLYQLGLGVFQNPNTLAHIGLALYDAKYNLLTNTTFVSLLNAADQQLIAALPTPYRLNASTLYYVTVWSDSYLYVPWTDAVGGSVEVYINSAIPWSGKWPSNWANVSSSIYIETTSPALQAWGCSTPLAPTPSSTAAPAPTAGSTAMMATSAASTGSAVTCPVCPTCPAIPSSTGASRTSTPNPATSALSPTMQPSTAAPTSCPSSSCSGTSLSAGAIVGIAISCAVGGLILGLFLAYCCLAAGGEKDNRKMQPGRTDSEQSTVGGGRGGVELSHVRHNGENMPEA